jgi:hypothetical protein
VWTNGQNDILRINLTFKYILDRSINPTEALFLLNSLKRLATLANRRTNTNVIPQKEEEEEEGSGGGGDGRGKSCLFFAPFSSDGLLLAEEKSIQ